MKVEKAKSTFQTMAQTFKIQAGVGFQRGFSHPALFFIKHHKKDFKTSRH
jgi:hypothetical protein